MVLNVLSAYKRATVSSHRTQGPTHYPCNRPRGRSRSFCGSCWRRRTCCQATAAFLPDMCARVSVARAPRVGRSRSPLKCYVANAGDDVAAVGGVWSLFLPFFPANQLSYNDFAGPK